MKNRRIDYVKSASDLALEPEGFAHALNLLLLAVRKTNPGVGALLDEFTAMHADYLLQIQDIARESPEFVQAMDHFTQATKLIYKRLSKIDEEQSRAMRAHEHSPVSSLRIH